MASSTQNTGSSGAYEVVAGRGRRLSSSAHNLCSDRYDSNATSKTPKSSTTASTSTKATSTSASGGGNADNMIEVAGNRGTTSTFPPSDPLIHNFGAQFADQLPPPPTPEQQAAHRSVRMMEFHNAFAELGVYLPQEILVLAENAHYGVIVPETVQAQFTARYYQRDPETLWAEVEDAWNTITGRMRAGWPELGTPVGWEDLEELPTHEQRQQF